MPNFTMISPTDDRWQDGVIGAYCGKDGWELQYGESQMTSGEFYVLLWLDKDNSIERVCSREQLARECAELLLKRINCKDSIDAQAIALSPPFGLR